MVITFVLIGLLCLYKIKFSFLEKDEISIYDDYMSLEKSNSIKGIFILIVLFSHISQNLILPDTLVNTLFHKINFGVIGQSMVSMFLLYSGYAITLCCINKGDSYIKKMPTRRILKVLIHFDIAVLLYLLLQTILGETFSLKQIVLSLIGWESLGNSNWYIFVILVLYAISYLAFTVSKENPKISLLLTSTLSVVLFVILFKTKEDYWYDTIFLYPIGMAWCIYKDKIDKFFKSHTVAYIILLLFCAGATIILAKVREIPGVIYIKHIFFALTILLFTMKVQINNEVLNFCGRHLFSIYILQRLPMILLNHFEINSKPVLYTVVTIAVTMLICVPFDMAMKKIDSVIFKK